MRRMLTIAAMLRARLAKPGCGRGAPSTRQTGRRKAGPARTDAARSARRSPAVRTVHRPGPHGGPLTFRGHEIHRAHLAPFVYPPGYRYQRWAGGMVLPPLFLVPAYFYADWAALGLVAPEAGFQWVRFGPDMLLVNVTTGQVVDAVYGVFY